MKFSSWLICDQGFNSCRNVFLRGAVGGTVTYEVSTSCALSGDGLRSTTRVNWVSGKNSRIAIASAPLKMAVTYSISKGNQSFVYPKVPAPPQGVNDKSWNKTTKTDATAEKDKVQAHPPSTFMEKENIHTNSGSKRLPSSSCNSTHDASSHQTAKALGFGGPNSRRKENKWRENENRSVANEECCRNQNEILSKSENWIELRLPQCQESRPANWWDHSPPDSNRPPVQSWFQGIPNWFHPRPN